MNGNKPNPHMKERLTSIHFEIIRNSICSSSEIADCVANYILQYTTDSEFAEVAIALMREDKEEVFLLMKRILNEAIWYMAEEQLENEHNCLNKKSTCND